MEIVEEEGTISGVASRCVGTIVCLDVFPEKEPKRPLRVPSASPARLLSAEVKVREKGGPGGAARAARGARLRGAFTIFSRVASRAAFEALRSREGSCAKRR